VNWDFARPLGKINCGGDSRPLISAKIALSTSPKFG
jgi:hypothetical protein